MPEQSSMHSYLSWTKERLDEMDAVLASLETKTDQGKTELRRRVDQLMSDLSKRRDEFQAQVKAQAEAGETAIKASNAQLESLWHGFEAQVESYFETIGEQIEQQQATFRKVAAAQAKAWREAADKLHYEAARVAATRRADMDAAIKQMRVDAAEAEARLQKLKQAGSDSWISMSSALSEARKAFDQANQRGWDALKRAAFPRS
ncbi:hypothetical protein ILFOPFJJ_05687 [Ensifer psoraleae]|uniref:hypothetical protein n=1 Tax=Sinorhizobium psoraleae TaxID=520838 RepID=UPI0015687C89|nr:hypothetical protein [Sinorhizobium psoraleae]NRP74765.1 hypothetical protein [Sinorhizobium psoraleae]